MSWFALDRSISNRRDSTVSDWTLMATVFEGRSTLCTCQQPKDQTSILERWQLKAEQALHRQEQARQQEQQGREPEQQVQQVQQPEERAEE